VAPERPCGKDLARLVALRGTDHREPSARRSAGGKDLARLRAVLVPEGQPAGDMPAGPAEKRRRLAGSARENAARLSLPADAAGAILRFVGPEAGAHDTMRLLDTLSGVSPAMHAALSGNHPLRRTYLLLQELWRAARVFLAAQPEGFQSWFPQLSHLLNPAEREWLVTRAMQSNSMGAMGSELAHLTPAQCTQLFEGALALPVPRRLLELQGLIDGLAHLTAEQQDALVTEVLRWPQADDLAQRHLAANLEHLPPVQRRRVVDHLQDLPGAVSKAWYVHHLATGMSYLEPDQRQRVADTAIGLGRKLNFQVRGDMLGALGAQARYLDPVRRQAIVGAAITDPSAIARKGAIVLLARGAAALSDAERDRLVSAAIDMPQEWARASALQGCAEHAGNFTSAQRSRVVAAITSLSEAYRPAALGAFSASADLLTEEDHDRLLAAARTIPASHARSFALAHLGQASEALALVRNHVLAEHGQMFSSRAEGTITELCKKVGALSEESRQQLLDLVMQLGSAHRHRAFGALSDRLSHLNEAQTQGLKDLIYLEDSAEKKAWMMATLARGINAMMFDSRAR
jgi:hypothetical protein